jgi:hypothetical protein
MRGRGPDLFLAAALVGAALLAARPVRAAEISAQAAAEQQEVFVGESFVFQIQVSGSENPEEPDLGALNDFTVQAMGGQQQSSRSVTIINGHMQQQVQLGYVFNYRLTPKRAGQLVIPSITVKADGTQVQTQPLSIVARPPMKADRIKLRMQLSKDHCYVGEPVILTVTWYIGQDVQKFQFTVPALDSDAFALADPKHRPRAGQDYVRIPLPSGEVIGEKGRGELGGREYATVRFSKILIPKHAGTLKLDPAVVACDALVGYRKSRSPFDEMPGDSFFDSLFHGDIFGGRQGVYKRVVAPSNPLTLDVRALPEKGRPPNFAGHIGEYHIAASAAPTDVNVGDPITLTVTLSGPPYLEHVGLPRLSKQPSLARDFKIPSDRAEGKVEGSKKVFTQTLRALRPDVKEIPPIELPYFDTKDGTYEVARTDAIPLHVQKARIVTAADAEGPTPTEAASPLEGWKRGIAYNYEGDDLLVNRRYGLSVWLRSPKWVTLWTAPPLCYLALLGVVMVLRRRRADPAGARARKAYGELSRTLQAARKAGGAAVAEQVLDALKAYLGDKLRRPARALTYKDVEGPLRSAGMQEEALARLKRLFQRCEAGRFAGQVDQAAAEELVPECLTLARQIERKTG